MIGSGQHLSQKQSLQQRLSPQQIQYIKLLQLPTLALEQRIKEEMELNPVLDEPEEESPDEESNEYETISDSDKETDGDDETDPVDQNEEIDWESFLADDELEGMPNTRYNPEEEEWRDLPKPYHESLLEDLENQVGLLNLTEREQMVADQILGSIDSDGYFRRDLNAIIDSIAFTEGKLIMEEEAEAVLKKVQRLDPPGIAARDLRECLITQLEMMDGDTHGRNLAIQMLTDHWELFEKKHFDKLKKKLNIDDEDLRDAYECIQLLDPKPGFTETSPDSHNYVIPDFEVYYKPAAEDEEEDSDEGEFIINLNSRNAPQLRISPKYKKMWDDLSKQKKTNNSEIKETRNFIRSKLESAKWFIDSILQRQNTLMSVMQTIVALQENFFKNGEGLRPMILKDVAERIHMDISTISRVVNGKYVQTPFGTYELKYFFNEGLETEDGEEVSNREVKNILQNLVENEDKRKPLSDQALAEALKEKGYMIARRTISKYREQLGIPVARLRKSFS